MKKRAFYETKLRERVRMRARRIVSEIVKVFDVAVVPSKNRIFSCQKEKEIHGYRPPYPTPHSAHDRI